MSGNGSTNENSKKLGDKCRIFPSTPDDEIVISGVAGRYPSSDNVDDFRENLFNKVGFRLPCEESNQGKGVWIPK